MFDERKKVKTKLTVYPSDFGLGDITAEFEADRYPDLPLLDTRVELTIQPFSVTWNDKEKLLEELKAVIAKYQI